MFGFFRLSVYVIVLFLCAAESIDDSMTQENFLEEADIDESLPIDFDLEINNVVENMVQSYKNGIKRVTKNARTPECKLKIIKEFNRNIQAIHDETTFPFERMPFHSECPNALKAHMNPYKHQGETYPPKPKPVQPKWRTDAVLDPDNLSILYVVLLDSHPHFATRMIEALQEPQHTFVVHVDLAWNDTYNHMVSYAATRKNVFVLQDRIEVQWGGFSIVNATLMGMKQGFMLKRKFDFVIDVSGTMYPLKSNQEIRRFLSRNSHSIYMTVAPDQSKPPIELWHSYVECDGALHRVGRLAHVRGISMHTGGQWFVFPTAVAEWFLTDPLPLMYVEYCQHVVIADENYFATMIKNSPYCINHIQKDLTFLVFTSFGGNVSQYKCLQPDPDRCGRSPTTLTMEMKSAVEMTDALFARKFDITNSASMDLLDAIDENRFFQEDERRQLLNHRDEDGNMFMIMEVPHRSDANGTEVKFLQNLKYNCLRMPHTWGDVAKFVPCHSEDKLQFVRRGKCIGVNPELDPSYKYDLCDDCLTSSSTPSKVFLQSRFGKNTQTDKDYFCQIQSILPGSAFESKPNEPKLPEDLMCLDITGQSTKIGAPLIGYQCIGLWNQYFRLTSDCHMTATQPQILGTVRKNIDQNTTLPTLCLQSTKPTQSDRADFRTAACQCSSRTIMEEKTEKEDRTQEFRYVFSKQIPFGMAFVNGMFTPSGKSAAHEMGANIVGAGDIKSEL